MERRRELRNLAPPFIFLDYQRPAWSGGNNACQKQSEKERSIRVAGFSFSQVVDTEARLVQVQND